MTYFLNGQAVGTTSLPGAVAEMASDFTCGGTAASPYRNLLPGGNGTPQRTFIGLPDFSYQTFFGTAPPTDGVVTMPAFDSTLIVTPEPSTAFLLGAGMLGLAVLGRRA